MIISLVLIQMVKENKCRDGSALRSNSNGKKIWNDMFRVVKKDGMGVLEILYLSTKI